jgi:hypothetical protein
MGTGSKFLLVDVIAESWRAAVAGTAPDEDVAKVRTAAFEVAEGFASRSMKVPAGMGSRLAAI